MLCVVSRGALNIGDVYQASRSTDSVYRSGVFRG